MSLTPDHTTPTHSPPPPDPGVNQGQQRRRVPTWLIGVGLFAVFIAMAAIVTHGGAPATPAAPAAAATHTVVYSLTTTGGAATADITYRTPTGIEQQQDVGVPLTSTSGGPGITLQAVQSGEFLSISGQLKTRLLADDDPDITCSITVDGVVVAKNTSRGVYSIASCDGRA